MVKIKRLGITFVIVTAFAGIAYIFKERDQILDTINRKLELQKGTAKWWHTHSSDESKSKGVFVCYYEALPFEYKDSIFQMKLSFNEVYIEWWHWYDWPDTLGKKCLFYKNSKTIKAQQLIGVYNPSKTTIGISRIISSNNDTLNFGKKTNNGIDASINFVDSLKCLNDFSNIIKSNDDYWVCFYWDAPCGIWPELIFSAPYYENELFDCNEQNLKGIFPDTIKIPIYSSNEYNQICGYEDNKRLIFGELILVKKK